MTGAKRVTGEDGKSDAARAKTAPIKSDAQVPKEKLGNPTSTSTTSKKTAQQNGTLKSTAPKGGETKTTKKRKRNNKNHSIGDTDRDTPHQKVQVKQRSISTVLDTGSSKIAVSDSATDAGAETPAADDTQGFASGNYGMLLETKRAEKLCLSLALQKRNIEAMLRAFKREELLGGGEITTAEFFLMLHEQPRQLTKATIATWSKSELLHYAFKQFDVDESGVMDGRELRAFCEGLKNDSSFYFAKNVNTAREKLVIRDRNNHHYKNTYGQPQIDEDIDANTLVDLEDLAKGSSEFQVAFYPLQQFQQNIRACALGENFWAGVTQRRHEVEVIVHYMRLNRGKLPSFSIFSRIIAYLMPFSQANSRLVVHKLAVLKFAEEQRLWQEQTHARVEADNLALTGIQEEGLTQPESSKR